MSQDKTAWSILYTEDCQRHLVPISTISEPWPVGAVGVASTPPLTAIDALAWADAHGYPDGPWSPRAASGPAPASPAKSTTTIVRVDADGAVTLESTTTGKGE